MRRFDSDGDVGNGGTSHKDWSVSTLMKAQQFTSSVDGLDKIKSRPWTSASLDLDSASRYATIPRRRGCKQVPEFNLSYYESCCEENASVSSLPVSTKPTLTYIVGGNEVKSSSIAHFYSLPPSSLPSVVEDDPYSFFTEYDPANVFEKRRAHSYESVDVDQCYFLPQVEVDEALAKWRAMDATGNYDDDFSVGYQCEKPKCLLQLQIGEKKIKRQSGNDLSMWL